MRYDNTVNWVQERWGDVKKGRFSYFCVSASRFHHYAWCNFICILHIFHDLYFNVVFFLSLINIMNIAVYCSFRNQFLIGVWLLNAEHPDKPNGITKEISLMLRLFQSQLRTTHDRVLTIACVWINKMSFLGVTTNFNKISLMSISYIDSKLWHVPRLWVMAVKKK